MTVPTFVNVGTIGEGVGAVTPGLPSGWAVNDIHLLIIEGEGEDADADPGPAAGWTYIGTVANDTGGSAWDTRQTLYWRRAEAGDSAPTVPDAGQHTFAVIAGFRGCITTETPIHQQNTSSDDAANTDITFPEVTTTVDDCLILHIATNGDNNTAGTWANAALANPSITEFVDVLTSEGSDGAIHGAYGGLETAGLSGAAASAVCSTSERDSCFTIALKPAPAAPELTIQSTRHAHRTDDLLNLTGVHNLQVNGTRHVQRVDNLDLTGVHNITILGTRHIHRVDSPTLSAIHDLVINGTRHSHRVDSLTLTGVHNISINGTRHSHRVDSLTLTGVHNISINGTRHAHRVDNVTLTLGGAPIDLVIQGTRHLHRVDNVILTQVHNIIVSDTRHAHRVDDLLILTQVHNLGVNGTRHLHRVDSLTLTQVHNILVNDTRHAHKVDSFDLSVIHNLLVNDTRHVHRIDDLTLTQLHNLLVNNTRHLHRVSSSNVEEEVTTLIASMILSLLYRSNELSLKDRDDDLTLRNRSDKLTIKER